MKKIILRTASLALAVVMLLGLSACSGKSNTLVMGTNAEFEPFEYLNGTKVVGFDVDMANEIAKDAKTTLKIDDMDFDSLISALAAGKIDMAIAGMSVTAERKKSVDFSDPYFTSSQVIIVNKDNKDIKKADDLKGKVVGVQDGTTGDLFVTDNAKAKKVVGFKSGVDAGIELGNGKLDAVVIDEQPAKKIVASNDKLMILKEKFTEEEYAIAVKKGNKKLLQEINTTLARMKNDGTYDKIYGKYFGTAK